MANVVIIAIRHMQFAAAPTPSRVASPPFCQIKLSLLERPGGILGAEVITNGKRPSGNMVRHDNFFRKMFLKM